MSCYRYLTPNQIQHEADKECQRRYGYCECSGNLAEHCQYCSNYDEIYDKIMFRNEELAERHRDQ